jgi:hypothetical protein
MGQSDFHQLVLEPVEESVVWAEGVIGAEQGGVAEIDDRDIALRLVIGETEIAGERAVVAEEVDRAVVLRVVEGGPTSLRPGNVDCDGAAPQSRRPRNRSTIRDPCP